ncbi:MAG TPA: SIR2 family protein [Pyrinomonadaceae bacterium]|nr:SIR2 family protein [Pyrinomonadaceae bacterium]
MPPPYGEIADLLKKGEVVPFLGAGVNFGARPAPSAKWDEKESTFLPSGVELSRFLADISNFPAENDDEITDLAKVSSYFVETSARRRLRERLHDIFDRDFEPASIHNYLAEIGRNAPLLIVTTNYDDLTEQAFNRLNLSYDLVVHPTDRKDVEASVLWWRHGAAEPEAVPPNQLFIDLKSTTVIYKMHGTVDRITSKWDSYVITEDDYIDFLSRMTGQTAVPAQFMRHFRTRHFLFLGYGLRDWNLRVVLKNLRTVLPTVDEASQSADDDMEEELRSWAIQFRPSDLEMELWNARKVKIYDVDINEFVEKLRARGV